MADEKKDWYLLVDAPALGLVLFGPTSCKLATALRDGTHETLEAAGCSVGIAPAQSLDSLTEFLEAADATAEAQAEMKGVAAPAPPSPTTVAARLLHQAARRLDQESAEHTGGGVRVEPAGRNPLDIRPGTYALEDLARAIRCLSEALESH